MPSMQNSTMDFCFAAESSLGKLVKWLRILGFDTLYEPDCKEEVFRLLEPGRILLTRQAIKHHKPSVPRCIRICSDHYTKQLLEVIRVLGIGPATIKPFSRCIRCNTAITLVEKEGLQGKVPDYIWETHDKFKICYGCQRIYWSGSHFKRAKEKIQTLFPP